MDEQMITLIRGQLTTRIRDAAETRNRDYDRIKRDLQDKMDEADAAFDQDVKSAWAEYDQRMLGTSEQ